MNAANEVDALNKQALQLYDQGKYKEALAVAEKALSLLPSKHRAKSILIRFQA